MSSTGPPHSYLACAQSEAVEAAVAAVFLAALLVPFGHYPAPIHFQGDAILFLYLFGLARFLGVLAALDTGSSFEGMGSAREVTFSALAEPALFLGFAALAKASGSASLSDLLASPGFGLSRAMAPFILVLASWVIVFLAENARIPVDDPNTHLELTMIHEGMLLEASGRSLATLVFASELKLAVLAALFSAAFLPFGAATDLSPLPIAFGVVVALAKMLIIGQALALLDGSVAKMRIMGLPDLLSLATLLALSGIGIQVLLP